LGSALGRASYELPGLLYPGHPFGSPVLGSDSSLAAISTETIRQAHRLGYDRSRAVFICVGNISDGELLEALGHVAAQLPNHNVAERRRPAYLGPLPTWRAEVTERETEFSTSVVQMLFPLRVNDGETTAMTEVSHMCTLLSAVFGHGGLASPLMKIVREERQLVYGCSTRWNTRVGGGYFGFHATAKKENIQPIIDAFHDVLKDPSLRQPERLASMKSRLKAGAEMMPIDPKEFCYKAISQFIHCGGVMLNYKEQIEWFDKISMEDVDIALSSLKPEEARVIIFKGTGKI